MSLSEAAAADYAVVDNGHIDPYQSKVEQVYADPPEVWQEVIGPELWFQFGIYDGDSNRTLDEVGRRYLQDQLNLAGLQSDTPIARILDVGCGWGAPLEYLARTFSHQPRIDGINVAAAQLRYAASRLAAAGLSDRVHLYRCNARDIDLLPDPDPPYDLVLMRGCITHFSGDILDAALRAIARRSHPHTVLVISENLHNTPLDEYTSALSDESDRLACGHRKTRESLEDALKQAGFAIRDIRPLPDQDDAVEWLTHIKDNIARVNGAHALRQFADLRDVAVNWIPALRSGAVSVYSIVATLRAERVSTCHSQTVVPAPTLWCPIPIETRSDAALLDRHNAAWVRRFRIGANDAQRDLLTHAEFGSLAAIWYRHAVDYERAQIAADFCAWFAAVDNITDEPDQPLSHAVIRLGRLQRRLDAPDSSAADDDPLVVALDDILNRLSKIAAGSDIARLADAWRTYALGAAWQLAQRAEGTAPTLEQYTELRLSSIGAKPITALYPSLNGYRLDDSEAVSPPVRAATEMAWLLSAWDNDLYSWHKDVSEGATHTNLVGIIVDHQRLDHRRAFVTAVTMRNTVMWLFLRLRERLVTTASAAVQCYLRDLGLFIAGSTEAYRDSPYYAHRTPSASDITPIKVSQHVSVEAVDALPIPSIAWWWDQLAR